jgi:hypothetical protein
MEADMKTEITPLSQRAKDILIEAARSEDGMVYMTTFLGNYFVAANHRSFGDGTSVANTENTGAIEELLSYGLVTYETESSSRQGYKLAAGGYLVAKDLEPVFH